MSLLVFSALLWRCSWPVGSTALPGVVLNNTLTIGYLVPWSGDWPAGPGLGSAITVGLREVERRGILPGFSFDWILKDTWCKPTPGFRRAVEAWSEAADMDAILGEACSVVCEPVSLLAASWNLPTISYGCTSEALSDKQVYRSFSRTVGTWPGLAPMFNALVDLFGWERLGFITTTEFLMLSTAQALQEEMEKNGKTIIYRTIDTTVDGGQINQAALARQREVVRAMKDQARIIIFFAYGYDVRNLLLTCYDEGMMNGGYAYMSFEMIFMLSETPTYRAELHDVIWDGFISSEPRVPSGERYDAFRQDVIDTFQEPEWDHLPHLAADAELGEVAAHAGLVHDAVLQWAYGVNKTLDAGGFADDGAAVTRSIINSTFEGVTGTVAIDENGNRKTDHTIIIFQNGQPVELTNWLAAEDRHDVIYPGYMDGQWEGLQWPGGVAQIPSDSPSCGWYGELCQSDDPAVIWTSVAMANLVILVIAAIFAYRRYTSQNALLDAKACCVSWSQITFRTEIKNINISSSFHSPSPHTISYSEAADYKRQGMFRDTPVNINPCHELGERMSDMDVWETIRTMRALHHENLIRFLAVVRDLENKCVLSEISTKGSLYTFLQDCDVTLSNDFQLSILSDIASGMQFLHSSIHEHGRLDSHCCLFDARWACKISDYWVTRFVPLGNKCKYEDITDAKATEMLWTAPEVLRGHPSSPKSDVFSYAVIVQEVITKDMPYGSNVPPLEPKEILRRVHTIGAQLYRPDLGCNSSFNGCRNLAELCWRENPEERPTFTRIRSILRELNGGRTISLADSMATRLEAHTRHLEDVVNERSAALAEEKTKSENLLCELLPGSVVERLRLGKQVEPETFDQVTLFFSDIVSFTRISAAATPLQIVNLLNSMYSMFDYVVRDYDAYKVATIGDAYMVASGLPKRNGDKHASEIALMSLSLLDSVKNFHIDHMPNTYVKLRIGLHTGSCVAGVTGLKTPRYLLFGDTVNTASRIESLGAPMRVHISDSTASLLEQDGRFILEPHNELYVPGYGQMKTSWLNGIL